MPRYQFALHEIHRPGVSYLLKKHRVCCIKDALVECLTKDSTHFPECQKMYGVFCDRADCWSECEIYKCNSAVNITERGESIGEKSSPLTKTCREADLIIDIVVYTKSCKSGGCEALSVLGDISNRLCACELELPVRRIIPIGFTREHEGQFDEDLVVITSSYRLEYIMDTCDASAVHKNTERKRTKRMINGKPG